MNNDLYTACEFAKLAANMAFAADDQAKMQGAQQADAPAPVVAPEVPTDPTVPVEKKKPAPEAGSQGVEGMTDNATLNPAVPGSSVYADASDALALAEAKEEAARILQKQASIIREMVYAEVQ